MLLTLLGFIGSARIIAAPFTINFSGPVTSFSDSAKELFGTDELGTPLTLSFTYDGSLPPAQVLPNSDVYFAPFGSSEASASLGDFNFHGPAYFYMAVDFGVRERIEGKNTFGDFLSISMGDTVGTSMHAQLIFPLGTLTHSTVIPDVAPSWTFLAIDRLDPDPARDFGFAQSTSEVGPDILSPVPEPTTYGLMGSLALLCIVVGRKLKRRSDGAKLCGA